MKVATFYPTRYGSIDATCTYEIAMWQVERKLNIRTTQMCILNHVKDYDLIHIVNSKDDVIEIVNNHDGTYSCDRTDKEIRRAHNLFKMWENGVFDI